MGFFANNSSPGEPEHNGGSFLEVDANILFLAQKCCIKLHFYFSGSIWQAIWHRIRDRPCCWICHENIYPVQCFSAPVFGFGPFCCGKQRRQDWRFLDAIWNILKWSQLRNCLFISRGSNKTWLFRNLFRQILAPFCARLISALSPSKSRYWQST